MQKFKLAAIVLLLFVLSGCDQIDDTSDNGGSGDSDSAADSDQSADSDKGDTSSDVECEYNGKTYKSGDSFLDDDGCNTCGCISIEGEGVVVCTEMACMDDHCKILSEDDCSKDTECTAIQGLPVNIEDECLEESEYAGCMSSESACGDAIVTTTDPDGSCWLFWNTCIPQTDGWNKGGSDMGNDCSDAVSENWSACD